MKFDTNYSDSRYAAMSRRRKNREGYENNSWYPPVESHFAYYLALTYNGL